MYTNRSEPAHDRADGDVSDQDDDYTLIHTSWHSAYDDHDFCVVVGDGEERTMI